MLLYMLIQGVPHELCLLMRRIVVNCYSRKHLLEAMPCQAYLAPWSRDLGKQIVKKRGDLPLASAVLGGLLLSKEATYSEWLKVLQGVQWQLTLNPAKCADILKLSYQDLPYYLKSSFLYVWLFP